MTNRPVNLILEQMPLVPDATAEGVSLAEALKAISTLDGRERTCAALVYEDGPQLVIGGGPNLFVVTYAESDESLWTLTSAPASSTTSHVLIIGGQEGEYGNEIVVSRDCVVEAVRSFMQDARRAEGLTWRQET